MRVFITLACTNCKQRNYTTTKNKRTHADRMELKKYCRFCNEHTLHRETR
jgi:large subunit ribosomal protein L33